METYRLPFATARMQTTWCLGTMNFMRVVRGRLPNGGQLAVQTSDLYLAVGTRLSLAQTGYNAKDYARNAKVIMVDIDQAELDKDTVNLHLKIQTDAKLFLKELSRQLSHGEAG